MKRAALYIRVSTDEQALRGDSLATQRDELVEYAKKNEYEIVDIYEDDGYTATVLNRPNLQRLLDDVRADKIDIILFTKIDRWSRGVKNYYKINEVLNEHKVNWKTIFEDYDTSTASGRLHINIMLSVAENESAVTSERIKAVFKNKIKNGEFISGNVRFGYMLENKKLVHDPEKAPIVKEFYDLYEYHHSIRKAGSILNEKYNMDLSYNSYYRMFNNEIYTGCYEGDKNFCESIISPERFERLQRSKSSTIRKTPSNRIYMFSGLVVCDKCGRKMTGCYYKNGDYYRYRCNGHYVSKNCTNGKLAGEHHIEEYLLLNIKPMIADYVKDKQYKMEVTKKKQKKKVDKAAVKKQMQRLKDLYIRGHIEIEEYDKEHEKLSALLVEEKMDDSDLKHFIDFINSDYEEIYKKLTKEEKRLLWKSLISRIVYHPGKEVPYEIMFT